MPTALPTVAGQVLSSDTSGTLSFSTVDAAFVETPQTISMNKTIAANINDLNDGTDSIHQFRCNHFCRSKLYPYCTFLIMAYGKIKADAIVYDNSGSDVEVSTADITSKAGTASPAFTGTPTAPTASGG